MASQSSEFLRIHWFIGLFVLQRTCPAVILGCAVSDKLPASCDADSLLTEPWCARGHPWVPCWLIFQIIVLQTSQRPWQLTKRKSPFPHLFVFLESHKMVLCFEHPGLIKPLYFDIRWKHRSEAASSSQVKGLEVSLAPWFWKKKFFLHQSFCLCHRKGQDPHH